MSEFEEQKKRFKDLYKNVSFPHLRREAILQDIALSLAKIIDILGNKNNEK